MRIITVRGVYKNNKIVDGDKIVLENVFPYRMFFKEYDGLEAFFNLKYSEGTKGWIIIQFVNVPQDVIWVVNSKSRIETQTWNISNL